LKFVLDETEVHIAYCGVWFGLLCFANLLGVKFVEALF
jgi:hypothetical protein